MTAGDLIVDPRDAAETQRKFYEAYDRGDYVRALKIRVLMARVRTLRLLEQEAREHEEISRAASNLKRQEVTAQTAALGDGADLLLPLVEQVEAELGARPISQSEAKWLLLMGDLMSADAFGAMAEQGFAGDVEFRRALAQQSRETGAKATPDAAKFKAALKVLCAAIPALSNDEITAELMQQFPLRSREAIYSTVCAHKRRIRKS
jgi:hypothetical protein